jgi:hypothetical protein
MGHSAAERSCWDGCLMIKSGGMRNQPHGGKNLVEAGGCC